MNIFALAIPVLVLGSLAVVTRLVHGSWIAPGAFFPFIWFFYMTIPLIAAPEYEVDSFGLWVIVIMVASFSLSSLLIPSKKNIMFEDRLNFKTKLIYLNNLEKALYYFVIIMSIISFISALLLVLYGLKNFGYKFSIFGLISLPNQFSIERYDETLALPLIIKFGIYMIFPASVLSGFAFNFFTKAKRRWIYFVPTVISILIAVIMSVRSGILISLALWISGYLCSRIYFHVNLDQLIKTRLFIGGFILVLLFLGLFMVTQYLRGGLNEFFVLDTLVETTKTSFFGYISLFTRWVGNYDWPQISFGRSTFAGIFEAFGLERRSLGFYKEIFDLTPASTSNVFSAFRGVIHDFTYPGSLIVLSGLAIFLQKVFIRCHQGNIYTTIFLSMFYAFVLYSPLISIFNYNSVLMAWVILFLTLVLVPRFRSAR